MARLPPQQSGERTEVDPLPDPTRKKKSAFPFRGVQPLIFVWVFPFF
jgi:hypothetical protein